MTIEQVREALIAAGVKETAIGLLQKEDMLDAVSLTAATADQLKTIGLTLGMAIKVKSAFKSDQPDASAVASVPVAGPALPRTIILQNAKTTNEGVLTNLLGGSPEAIEEARQRFGTEALFVPRTDGSLDVKATIDYLGWKTRAGTSRRFKNSDGQSVQLLDINGLLNVVLELNPVTGEVLVPGDQMLDLTRDQRLLISYAVVTRRITGDVNIDLIIEQVQRSPLPGTFAQTAADLESARRNQTDDFRRAEDRLSRRSERVHSSGGDLVASGHDQKSRFAELVARIR